MKKTLVLCILDGFGCLDKNTGNAINLANKPNFDYLLNNYPNTLLDASGKSVGLPEGQMGNSEVGHLTIGSGRVLYFGLSLINEEVRTGKIYNNKAINEAINHSLSQKSNIHVMGLFSNGGVHAHQDHILSIIDICNSKGLVPVLHIFSDGRDVAQKQMLESVSIINNLIKDKKVILGTVSGRYYSMDRDKNFERTQKAYNAFIHSSDSIKIDNYENYIKESYDKDIHDEFIEPAYFSDSPALSDNDSVILANFRPDRARQISHLIQKSNLYDYNDLKRKDNLFFVTLSKYEEIEPNAIAYPPYVPENVLGKVLEQNNISQLRITETEKYAHVTFFFDGGQDVRYKNSEVIMINSPKVATYDLKPEMSALEITDSLIQKIGHFDVVIMNFANADMVGHTGNLEATIKAIETLDSQIKRIYDKIKEVDGTLMITADHGNAEIMIDDNNNPSTKHTSSPVPFIITNKDIKLKNSMSLTSVAATVLDILKIKKPDEMDESLING
jgi:2,3-bisphosphoglycerate-independent phosphoglycerate mutase